MKTALIGSLLICAASSAASQAITGALHASHDSDAFNERKQTLGYAGADGWGVKAGAVQYAKPGWSTAGTSVVGTYHEENAQRQVNATLGLARIAQHGLWVGSVDYLQSLQPGTAWGVSVERDVVNSQLGLQRGLTYTAFALVADHAFNNRFGVGFSGGVTAFSNDNQRLQLRTRWSYSLDEAYGFNAYLKTRSYRHSQPNQPEYFSPNHLHEAALGLSVRLAVADNVVLNASVDAGQQWVDAGSQAIWSALVGLSSGRGSSTQWRLGLETSNSASQLSSQSDAYRYTSAVAQLTVPW